jgi:branched-chain amino acid transport system substrate-binding protein
MLNKKFILEPILFFICLLVFLNAHAIEPKEIILGQSAPLSGNFSELGSAYRDGANLYFDKVNGAGGVNGRQIKLITLDDAYDAKHAVANTRRLIEKDKVIALFGYMFTNTVFATLPIAAAAGVPYVGPYAGNDELYAHPANPVLFMTRASYSSELDALLRHVNTMRLNRVALVRYDSVGGAALQNDLEMKMKAQNQVPVGISVIKLNAPADVATAASLARLQPSAIVLGVSGKDAVAFVHEFNRANKKAPVQFLARSLIGGNQLVAELSDEARGIVISQTAPSPFNGKTRVSREYQTALKTRFSKTNIQIQASYIGLEGFIAAKVMVEGLRRTGSNLSRPNLANALASIRDWDTGDFVINYSDKDHGGSRFFTVTVVGANGHFIE